MQDEAFIREQFLNPEGCSTQVEFLRTLMNDVMCEDSTPMHRGDARPVRQMNATDLPAVELFLVGKSIGYPASTLSEISALHRVQNTLALIGIESRRFFLTKHGHMGLGPPESRIGDEIFLLDGGSWPFLLRPSPFNVKGQSELSQSLSRGRGLYRFVGDCYVQGCMHGDGLHNYPQDWQDVYLV